MTPKQTLFVFSALLLVTTSGCSGSRMRNLISRSDYMTAEELETQDALTAEREEASRERALAAADKDIQSTKRTDTLVSSERTVNADYRTGSVEDEDRDEPPRKSFLNIAGLFKKKSLDGDVSPDPFIAIAEPDAVKKAEAEQAIVIATESEEKVQKFENTIAALEKEAENVFDQAKPIITEAVKTASLSADTNAGELAVQDEPHSGTSFADFTAQRRNAAKAVVVEDLGSKTKTFDTFAQTTDATVSDFDAILKRDVPKASVEEFSSALFPGLNEVEAEISSTFAQKKEAAESLFADIANTEMAPPATDDRHWPQQTDTDSFAHASEKHGFAKLNQRDPWAAFDSKKDDRKPVEPTIISQHANPSSNNEFIWSNNPASVSEIEKPRHTKHVASNAFTFDATPQPNDSDDSAVPSPFTQVSSSEVTNSFDSLESPGLVIPGGTTTQPVLDNEFTIEPFQVAVADELVNDDPFLNDPFAEASVSTLSGDNPDAEPAAATSSLPFGLRWTTRSWFLLIGCILVACLLFLPDRQNRFNA